LLKCYGKRLAYVEDGSVYFQCKISGIWKTFRKTIDELDAGARVEIRGEKHHPADFALWKKLKKPRHELGESVE